WNIREWHDRLAFSERWQRPFGQAENTEPCHRHTAFKNFPTRLLRHIGSPLISVGPTGQAIVSTPPLSRLRPIRLALRGGLFDGLFGRSPHAFSWMPGFYFNS